MERIVVGVSGDRTVDPGLLWALFEAARAGVPVVAVHAWPGEVSFVGPAGAAPVPWAATEDRARDRLDAAVKAAREAVEADGVDVQALVATGTPARVLERVAEDDDVLVLTRRHVTLWSRLVHGSVSTVLLRRTLGAVVVVPRTWRPTPFPGRVLVGVDRSSGSLRALTWAAREAERRNVPLVPVLVRSLVDGEFVPESVGIDRADLARWAAQLPAPRTIRPQVLAGDPGQVLVQTATADDLLVVGRTGATGVSQLADRLLGSTSSYVVRHAGCPVAVTPE